MKITHNKVGRNLNLTDSSKAEKSGGADKTKSTDEKNSLLAALDTKSADTSSKVNLSQRAQDIKKAKEIAMATPDIREEKVAALQKLIDSGKYKVDAKEIADKMGIPITLVKSRIFYGKRKLKSMLSSFR